MIDSNSGARLQAYPCTAIPRLAEFMAQDELRDALLRETGGGEAFLDRAAVTIALHVLSTAAYAPGEVRKGLLHRLYGRHTQEQIARAMALAWLNKTDHFLLPRRGWRDWLATTPVLLTLAVGGALVGVSMFVDILYLIDHTLAAKVLTFPPVLAFVGWPIALVLYRLLQWLFVARHIQAPPSN